MRHRPRYCRHVLVQLRPLSRRPLFQYSVHTSMCSSDPHCKANPNYVFLFWVLRCLSPNSHIHMSVSDLYIPRISTHISCSIMGWSIVGIYKSLTNTWMWNMGLWKSNSFSENIASNFWYWFFAVCKLDDSYGPGKAESYHKDSETWCWTHRAKTLYPC